MQKKINFYAGIIISIFAFAALAHAAGEFLVDDFEETANSIGGRSSTYEKEPSRAMSARVSDESFSGSRSLAINYNKKNEGGPYGAGGWCGYYTILKDGNRYFDGSGYKALTFQVKGAKGGENFKVGIADRHWEELGDSVKSDMITKYLPEGKITAQWQKAVIPLKSMLVEKKELASIAVCFESECFTGSKGEGTVYIDDLKFESTLPVSEQKEEIIEAPKAEPDPQHPRSLWVWKLDVLGSSSDRRKLFDLCQGAGISNLYVYFGDFNPANDAGRAAELAQFLKDAHAKGLTIEALNGKPSWAFKQYHSECLEWIKSVKDTAVDGISLDIEPYMTSEWQSGKEAVCSQFIGLLEKARAVLAGQKVRLTVAAASFYSQIGKGRFVEDILQYADCIAVMDYYDSANRIVEEAEPYLAAADKLNKKIAVGVETQDLASLKQGDRRLTFFEEGWEEMERVLAEAKERLATHPSFEGFAIHCDYSYMALQKGRNAPIKQRPDKTYTVKSVKKAADVVVDGNLSDWNLFEPFIIDKEENVVYGRPDWAGPKDLSAKAWSMWDEENIYFAFYITDNKILQEKQGKDMWEGDHIEMWLDTDLEGDYNEAINSNDDIQFGFSPGNFNNLGPEAHIWTPVPKADYSKDIKIAAGKASGGYIIETRIPATALGINPKDSARFGISIDPSDTDDPSLPQKVLISSSPDRVWGDPTTFGILELE